jgi:predicted regulator of Ras-like GTPase activity (Roadblock/LC7/MglB family)
MKRIKEKKDFKSSLEELLEHIMNTVEGVKAAQLAADTGQPLVSVLPSNVDDMRFAAINAALCSLAERAISDLDIGNFEQLYVKGSKGYLLILHAGQDQVLTVSTTKDIKLGPILYQHKKHLDEDLSSESGNIQI